MVIKAKFLKVAAAAFICCAALMITADADLMGVATVNASVRIRSGAGTAYSTIGAAYPGSTLSVAADAGNGWYKIACGKTEGYVSADYLTLSEEAPGDLGKGYINGNRVRLRSEPATSSAIVQELNYDTELAVLALEDSWYRVVCNGVNGYVHSDYVRLAGEAAPSGTAGETIVSTAKKYLGSPYVWGGTSPSGFDCSGLVNYVFKQCGYAINRTAAAIYQNGTYVEKADLQPGDVICFVGYAGGTYINHIGIYIGGGEFIHASTYGVGVIISDLNSGSYPGRYFGARRIAG